MSSQIDDLTPIRNIAKEMAITIHKDVTDVLSLESAMNALSERIYFLNSGSNSTSGAGSGEDNTAKIFFLTEKPNNTYNSNSKYPLEEQKQNDFSAFGQNYYDFFTGAIIDNELKSKVRFVSLCNLPYRKNHPDNVDDYLRLYIPILLRHIELFKPKIIFCYSSVVWKILNNKKELDIIHPFIKQEKDFITLQTIDEKHSVKIYQILHPYIVLEKENDKKKTMFYKMKIQRIIKENFYTHSSVVDDYDCPPLSTTELMKKNVKFFIDNKEKQKLAKTDKKVDIQMWRDAKNKQTLKDRNRNEKFTSMAKGTKDINSYFTSKKPKTEE